MTGFGTTIASLLVAGAAAAGGLLVPDSDMPPSDSRGTALVIDAPAARDGRDLVDPRLRAVDAQVRLPRTSTEALTNVRYFAAQGYRVVVSGPLAIAAARDAGVDAERRSSLPAALAASRSR